MLKDACHQFSSAVTVHTSFHWTQSPNRTDWFRSRLPETFSNGEANCASRWDCDESRWMPATERVATEYWSINPFVLQRFSGNCHLDLKTLLMITLELWMILQNIWMRVVGNVRNNISPLNIFPTLLLLARFHQNCQGAFVRFKIK